MTAERPDPEKLLKRIKEEERQAKRGKLKIYLGAAPGVGKTYSMLNDALSKLAQGLDVVAGVVETHKRKEIEFLLEEFEVLPRLSIDYKGHKLTEFDLDAALKRNPGLILIDEMAHTNAPGLRHAKRWQDIRELLDRGIDVYTTLNVQHIESLNDVVAQIIHSHVKETVPDGMIEMADTIELVDLPPEDLLKRLQEGKIYYPENAEIAADNYFRKGNLIALRELALRATAERVSAQVLLYRQGQGIKHIWPTKGKILVCVGNRADSTKLIRAARRMAKSLQVEWIAVHVDTPRLNISEEQRNIAIENLRFAEQLGAETRTLTGFDVVKEIMNFAHEQNITMIMVWKHIRSRFRDLLFSSLADEIVRLSGEIDVYIVTGEMMQVKSMKVKKTKPKFPWKVYGIACAMVVVTTYLNFLLFPILQDSTLIYFVGVVIVALFGYTGPSIFISVLSVLADELFFVPPYYVIFGSDYHNVFTLVIMILVGQVISHLTMLVRRQSETSNVAERHLSVQQTLNRQLASTRGVDKIIESVTNYLSDVFESEVLVMLFEDNALTIRNGSKGLRELSPKEQSVAQWVYDLRQNAGLGTDTLPFSDALYLPLLTSQGSIGVLRMQPIQPGRLFTPEEMHLLESCVNQVAVAIEADRLQEERKRTELETATDHMRSALLHSVSHDLRTPLVAVIGGANTLMEMGNELDGRTVKKIGKEIYKESEQLKRLINNLLQITYLEAEAVTLQKKLQSLNDVIHHVVIQEKKKIGKKPIESHIPDNLPMVPFDQTLIEEVLNNLLDNAIKYTPVDSPIEIYVKLKNNSVLVSVEDHGPGIVLDEINRLFEKFYRGRMLTAERGLGLGLPICKSIIKAHGGNIWAENLDRGGAAFRFTLPLQA